MTTQPFRLATGGLIDRGRKLAFTFDGVSHSGHAGDTLASALLANGVRLVGRSFKYHRPRGIYTAGPEEPNALVRLRGGDRAEPNTRATMIELFDGLAAESQNRWPSLAFDLGAVASLAAPLIPAGFYYKTFMGPPGWHFYEHFIRRAAGLGRAPAESDPDAYEKRNAHCDVLVVGGGPAGLAAALAAGRTGARVLLVDERPELGGSLRREQAALADIPASAWLTATLTELGSQPETRLLQRATAVGYYDHNLVAVVERTGDHLATPPIHGARQVLWLVRAKEVVLATGAIERPLIFADNDRPNIMLASAARAYVNEYAVAPGRRAVVATNNDSAYATALDLHRAGIAVAAVVDARDVATSEPARQVQAAGILCLPGSTIAGVKGGRQVTRATVVPVAGKSNSTQAIDCDLVCVSGGWNPTVHLHSQSGGKIAYDEAIAGFVPGQAKQRTRSVGGARGNFSLADGVAEGLCAGAEAARDAGFGSGTAPPAPEWPRQQVQSMGVLPATTGRGKRFVDLQNDVVTGDLELATREGFVSVEHLKRYTTLGMGTDQGKTSNVNGLAILAGLRNAEIPAVGTTTFRPPYTPFTLGNLAARETGLHFEPIRRSPMHAWHQAHGTVWVEAGLWLRPSTYPRAGESLNDAIKRETRAVRNGVGLVDVSTLGKIEIEGPDAAEFLDRVYVNNWKTLAIGRARYGLMLREDGMVFDDGTTSRLGEQRYVMTTTTANAAKVLQHLEFYLQAVWPELRANVTSVTDQWAAMALAGPKSRAVLERVTAGVDVGNASLPHMGAREIAVAGVKARIFRISFSGELAYEINVPADQGAAVWEALLAAGAPDGITAYGTEAMGVMRIEKGHVAGAELNGNTTAEDLGLGRLVSGKKDCIGRRSLTRPALTEASRLRLVGLVPVDVTQRIRSGAQLVEGPAAAAPVKMLGHVTSTAFSPNLGHSIALALLSGGLERKGTILHAAFPLRNEIVAVRVTDPVFLDPKGERLHA